MPKLILTDEENAVALRMVTRMGDPEVHSKEEVFLSYLVDQIVEFEKKYDEK